MSKLTITPMESDQQDDVLNILVLNQHGDNRGDEAAFRAMVAGIEELASTPVRFTVLHQFADDNPDVDIPQTVRWISLVPSIFEATLMGLFTLTLIVGFPLPKVLGSWGRAIVNVYRNSDIAVSAPGGPYFGDPYSSHEIVHWFYVWLADRFDLPMMLYAPSVGPFDNWKLNPVRRRLFTRFEAITIREEVSLKHLQLLMEDRSPEPILATDAALQRPLSPLGRREYFGPERRELIDTTLVGVSAIDWRYPGHPDPEEAHRKYEETVLDALIHLNRHHGAHLLLVPQLFGSVHSDVPYLKHLGARLPSEVSWEIVDPKANSNRQQRIFGMVDIYFASRYHPQIFGISNSVPGVCIYYEHKALGFIRQLDLERFAFPIDNLEPADIRGALDEVLANRRKLSRWIGTQLPALRKASARSSEMTVALFDESSSPKGTSV